MSTSIDPKHRPVGFRRPAAVLALALVAGVVTGCGSGDSPESGTGAESGPVQQEPTLAEVASAYTGPYDKVFRADVSSYAGQQVTLTGEVADLVPSRSSLVLTDPEDPVLDPLLVSAQYAFPDAEQGAVVQVTGTVRSEFDAEVVEDDDEAGFYDRHVGEPYLDQATLGAGEPAGR